MIWRHKLSLSTLLLSVVALALVDSHALNRWQTRQNSTKLTNSTSTTTTTTNSTGQLELQDNDQIRTASRGERGKNESVAGKSAANSSEKAQQVKSAKSCSPVASCTVSEFDIVLQKIIYNNEEDNEKILETFKQIEAFVGSGRPANGSILAQNGTSIRPSCVRELIRLIKSLASNELEMKTMLEFASGPSPSRRQLKASLRPARISSSSSSSSSLEGLNKLERLLGGFDEPSRAAAGKDLDLSQLKWLHLDNSSLSSGGCEDSYVDEAEVAAGVTSSSPTLQVAPSADDSSSGQQVGAEKGPARVLPKLVANVDHLINTLERFTLTREWSSLIKVSQGAESILEMFVSKTETPTRLAEQKAANRTSSSEGQQQQQKSSNESVADFVAKLRVNLPKQVLTLTGSLNNLFPWHVWPWNNLDLYSTVDTFLNHGIFAFSKTTVGPERRIDFLHDMLQTLFKSLKFDSFPKKCNDWSRIICDKVAFHERLVLNSADEPDKVKELLSVTKNQLTQELTCIMFSSLSMQQFGAKELEAEQQPAASERPQLDQQFSASSTQLAWDRQVLKAIRLYTLAREALSDNQWLALYNLINNLWAQQKIPDRVIMVGRVVQLLTNCHMPREMLESALWKDIYKYKNVLNQLLDIVIEELNRSSETGKLSVEQLTLGSKHLEEIVSRLVRLLPKLVDSLTRTVVEQLPELVNKFFADKSSFFKVPCKGKSFSDIVDSLAKHRGELVEVERLICAQLATKPNITMMQINNLTNEFLAMALNFSTLGNALAFPKLLGGADLEQQPIGAVVGKPPAAAGNESAAAAVGRSKRSELIEPPAAELGGSSVSIIDEMAANPRLAQIVAILQSSALDPPEVHAELPELDWVEAGTSVALLYESIQRLISYEDTFVVFPEIEGFQEGLSASVARSQETFAKFSKRDPIRLFAYSLDAVMPIALRTFKHLESFHGECLSSFKDIFSAVDEVELSGSKSAKQWPCFISGSNFASWAINRFLKTFNAMFRNILSHASHAEGTATFPAIKRIEHQNDSSCIFFDGSVSMMLDNLPHFIDLVLETVLMASTTADGEQLSSLYDIMCSSNYMLDPFNERSIELKARMKDKMCHLFHKRSLANCAQVLKFDQWKETMRELNSTWFEASAVSIEPSFREITLNAHELLELFGQFRPSTMSDSLLARVLNVNSFWNNLLARIMGIIDKYQEKRFEYALQTLTPIIYDNLPTDDAKQLADIRDTLITTILGARAILNHLDDDKARAANSSQFETQIKSLFSWADQCSLVSAEVSLRTMATNISQLEEVFRQPSERAAAANHSSAPISDVWARFCAAPLDRYLDLTNNSSSWPAMEECKNFTCNFEWRSFYETLAVDSSRILANYPERQLTRIALTKWGQVLDVMLIESKHSKQLPKFFYMDHWQELVRVKLPAMSPLKEQPSNLVWIWEAFERLVNATDAGRAAGKTAETLVRILDQLNCGLDAVKGGLSWANIGNIYQDKQDILAAHSTINNGFALASIGVNTLLAHKKFQKFLDKFVKPRVGLNAFCEIRDQANLESTFSIPPNDGQDFYEALESFQVLICDTSFDTLAQNINPISVCYQPAGVKTSLPASQQHPLADMLDRFFKLASLAVLDAKLVAVSDAKPPILDKNQWSTFWRWWSDKAEPQPKSSVALVVVRAFQTLDSINAEHVVWKALFRTVHEVSEVVTYLLRAVEKKHNEVDLIGATSRLSLVKDAAAQLDSAMRSNGIANQHQQQQLASTLSNIMFPEVNNFISFRTFKQLRYIKLISDYFVLNAGAQETICRQVGQHSTAGNLTTTIQQSRIELIGFKLNSNERLNELLCHYHSSQWLTALNIILSARTSSIPKKVNHMTRWLSTFTRNYYRDNDTLSNFIHGQQLENVENVANTTVTYLLATSQSLKSLSFSKISNLSWHSLPNLLDSIDRHLCASKFEPGTFQIPVYEPRKPELETVLCKLPQWNITQVYEYLSENFDLQNLISLITQKTNGGIGNYSLPSSPPSASLSPSSPSLSPSLSPGELTANSSTTTTTTANTLKTCVTPFKFASRWLRIGQEIADEVVSKSSKDKLRKCLSLSKKGRSVYSQSLRYIKVLNSLLASINDLTGNNSWHVVRRTWTSISYLILDQSPAYL